LSALGGKAITVFFGGKSALGTKNKELLCEIGDSTSLVLFQEFLNVLTFEALT
jgi:hypothetical protein